MTPNRDKATGLTPVEVITPGVYSADINPTLIDLLDFGAATLLLHIGIGGIVFTGANKIEFVLTAGDLADGSDQAIVTDADLVKDALAPAAVQNGIVRSLVAAHAAADIQKLGYVGGHRYIKLLPDFSGVHGNGTPIAVSVVKALPIFEGVA